MNRRATCLVVLAALAFPATAAAQAGASPDAPAATAPALDPAIRSEVNRAQAWAALGFAAPLAVGLAINQLSGYDANHQKPMWARSTSSALVFGGLAFGPSLGHYRGGLPIYATLSGLGRAAILAGVIAYERRQDRSSSLIVEFPVVGLAGVAAVLAWDVVDLVTIRPRVRKAARARASASPIVVPVASATDGGLAFGLSGRF